MDRPSARSRADIERLDDCEDEIKAGLEDERITPGGTRSALSVREAGVGNDQRRRRPTPFDRRDGSLSVHVGQAEIEQDDVRMPSRGDGNRLRASAGRVHFVPTRFEKVAERLSVVIVALDDEHASMRGDNTRNAPKWWLALARHDGSRDAARNVLWLQARLTLSNLSASMHVARVTLWGAASPPRPPDGAEPRHRRLRRSRRCLNPTSFLLDSSHRRSVNERMLESSVMGVTS